MKKTSNITLFKEWLIFNRNKHGKHLSLSANEIDLNALPILNICPITL